MRMSGAPSSKSVRVDRLNPRRRRRPVGPTWLQERPGHPLHADGSRRTSRSTPLKLISIEPNWIGVGAATVPISNISPSVVPPPAKRGLVPPSVTRPLPLCEVAANLVRGSRNDFAAMLIDALNLRAVQLRDEQVHARIQQRVRRVGHVYPEVIVVFEPDRDRVPTVRVFVENRLKPRRFRPRVGQPCPRVLQVVPRIVKISPAAATPTVM